MTIVLNVTPAPPDSVAIDSRFKFKSSSSYLAVGKVLYIQLLFHVIFVRFAVSLNEVESDIKHQAKELHAIKSTLIKEVYFEAEVDLIR